MELLLLLAVLILAIDGFSAYWVTKRIFASVADQRKVRVYKYFSCLLIFFVFAAVSLYVLGSNIRLQR